MMPRPPFTTMSQPPQLAHRVTRRRSLTWCRRVAYWEIKLSLYFRRGRLPPRHWLRAELACHRAAAHPNGCAAWRSTCTGSRGDSHPLPSHTRQPSPPPRPRTTRYGGLGLLPSRETAARPYIDDVRIRSAPVRPLVRSAAAHLAACRRLQRTDRPT